MLNQFMVREASLQFASACNPKNMSKNTFGNWYYKRAKILLLVLIVSIILYSLLVIVFEGKF